MGVPAKSKKKDKKIGKYGKTSDDQDYSTIPTNQITNLKYELILSRSEIGRKYNKKTGKISESASHINIEEEIVDDTEENTEASDVESDLSYEYERKWLTKLLDKETKLSLQQTSKETMKKLNLDAINNKNIKKAMENRTRRIVASEFDKLRKTLEKKIQEKFQKDVKNAQRDIEKRKKDAEKQIEQDKKD